MESIVKNGDFAITDSHSLTDDKFERDGEYYSSKPPVLSVIGAGLYYPLHFMGYSLPEKPYYGINNFPVYIITLLLVGSSYLALLYFFYRFCKLLKLAQNHILALLAGLAIGTLYFTYSITLNNHTIAGSLLFISFYLLFRMKLENNPSYSHAALAGFLSALAATIEIQTGTLFFIIFLIYAALLLRPKFIMVYCLGALIPATLHIYLNIRITGSILPIQLLAGDEIGLPGLIHNKENIFLYIFNITVGSHGLLLYSPILLLAFVGMFRIIKNRCGHLFGEAILIASGFFILALFYISKIRFYTGSAYGFRWFIAIVPLLYIFTTFVFLEPGKSVRKYFSTLLIISFMLAEIGIVRPWSPSLFRIYNPVSQEHMLIEFPLLANIRILKNRIIRD